MSPQGEEATKSREEAGAARPLILLVVDDDEVDRMTIRRALMRAGVPARIDDAGSAAQGLEMAGSAQYDCILLDYNLPGRDGLSLLRAMRAQRPEIPVVMLTGHGDEEVAVALMKAGASDYLPKGAVTPERLAASVRYAVEVAQTEIARQRIQRELQESRARTEHLQLLTVALTDAPTPDHVREVILEHGVLPMGACAGAIAALTENGEELEVVASAGYPADHPMVVGKRWPLGAAIPLAESIRSGSAVFVVSPDAWAARYGASGFPIPRATDGGGAWVSAPLFAEGVARGAVLWTFAEPREFPDADRAFMNGIAQVAMQGLERGQLREAERLARSEAEAANRAKSDFLARMSHDLRTPLNAIGGYAQLVQLGVHGPVNAAQSAALERINRAQHHLLQLITDILSFAKIEAGHVKVEAEIVPVASVLGDVRLLIANQAAAKGLAVEWECGEGEIAVWADRQRVEQILINLATNAVKFTQSGTIRLSCQNAADRVLIEVADTGCGMAPADLARVFEPFVQTAGSTRGRDDGVGLGLAISRELAELMGGHLTVESTLGRGSVFRVDLPRHVPLRTESGAPEA